jgi:hypothetical protein
MQEVILSWSGFLLRNRHVKINGKTYKKDGPHWILEMYKVWLENSDTGRKLSSSN